MTYNLNLQKMFSLLLVLVLSVSPALAQQLMKVVGSIVDQSSEPMIGVTVKVKGHDNLTTVSDVDGKFAIRVPRGTTLVFSYLGYQTAEQEASPLMKISMQEDTRSLDDVVVVGYGVQKKSSVTGAISQVYRAQNEAYM